MADASALLADLARRVTVLERRVADHPRAGRLEARLGQPRNRETAAILAYLSTPSPQRIESDRDVAAITRYLLGP